jgi:hypothetical protein
MEFRSMIKISAELLVFINLLLILQGCALLDNNTMSRGKLSDAMAKASDQNKGSRVISESDTETTFQPYPDDYIFSEINDSENKRNQKTRPLDIIFSELDKKGAGALGENKEAESNSSNIPSDSKIKPSDIRQSNKENQKEKNSPFGIMGGVGIISSQDFSEMINLNITLGGYHRDKGGCIYLGGSWAGVDRTSKMDNSINDGVFLINLGVDLKNSFFNNSKWHMPYFIYGGAYRHMFWTYENQISTSDGTIISSDSLSGIELHAGLGKSVLRTKGRRIGIEVVPSIIFWLWRTDNGFANDVFDPFIFLNMRAIF